MSPYQRPVSRCSSCFFLITPSVRVRFSDGFALGIPALSSIHGWMFQAPSNNILNATPSMLVWLRVFRRFLVPRPCNGSLSQAPLGSVETTESEARHSGLQVFGPEEEDPTTSVAGHGSSVVTDLSSTTL